MSLEADAALVLRHALARKHVADDAAVTLLCVGDSETFVVSGPAGESPSVIRIPIGSGAAGHVPFHHDPPTALELENAIAVVEDQVMPLAKRLPRPSVLVGMGGAMGGRRKRCRTGRPRQGSPRAGRRGASIPATRRRRRGPS